jgi:hypothetical protein
VTRSGAHQVPTLHSTSSPDWMCSHNQWYLTCSALWATEAVSEVAKEIHTLGLSLITGEPHLTQDVRERRRLHSTLVRSMFLCFPVAVAVCFCSLDLQAMAPLASVLAQPLMELDGSPLIILLGSPANSESA